MMPRVVYEDKWHLKVWMAWAIFIKVSSAHNPMRLIHTLLLKVTFSRRSEETPTYGRGSSPQQVFNFNKIIPYVFHLFTFFYSSYGVDDG